MSIQAFLSIEGRRILYCMKRFGYLSFLQLEKHFRIILMFLIPIQWLLKITCTAIICLICNIFFYSVKYPGFIFHKNDHRKNPNYISHTKQTPTPSYLTNLESFLDMIMIVQYFVNSTNRLSTENRFLSTNLLLMYYNPKLDITESADTSNYDSDPVIK